MTGGPLCLYREEVRNGEFEELEAFLIEHNVAFCRLSEGKYELMPEQVDFRPGLGRFESITDHEYNPVVHEDAVRRAIEPLGKIVECEQPVSHLEIAVIWNSINALLGKELPPLEPFSIREEQA